MSHQTTDEILLEFGVHVGYGDKRTALADDLARGSLTGGDLQMVCQWLEDQGTKKSAPARLAAILGDRDRWGPILADLRVHHQIRNAKQAMRGGKKAETGADLRQRDMDKLSASDCEFFGMTSEEMANFRWRFIVAEWVHGGVDTEIIEKDLGATLDEQRKCAESLRKGVRFDEALAEHSGK